VANGYGRADRTDKYEKRKVDALAVRPSRAARRTGRRPRTA